MKMGVIVKLVCSDKGVGVSVSAMVH